MINSFASSKHTKKILIGLSLILISLLLMQLFSINSHAMTVGGVTSGKITIPLQNFYKEYKGFINVFMGFIILTNILIFIYHFMKLGATATNPQARSKCLSDMFISGVCLALTGGGAVVMYLLFYLANK